MSEKADWKSVGDSLKTLGDRLSAHANEGAVDQAKAGGKAAVDKFDEATKDPEVGAALKDATNKFFDAVKVTLTGGDTPAAEPAADPAPPKLIEPPQEQ